MSGQRSYQPVDGEEYIALLEKIGTLTKAMIDAVGEGQLESLSVLLEERRTTMEEVLSMKEESDPEEWMAMCEAQRGKIEPATTEISSVSEQLFSALNQAKQTRVRSLESIQRQRRIVNYIQ